MAKKLNLRDQLLGSQVLINDTNGDGYEGLLISFDETMAKLVGAGVKPVRFIDGETKTVVELGPWAYIPADRVKFIVEAS